MASIKNGRRFLTHGDHLGSAALTTDDQGNLVEEIGTLLFRNAYQNGIWTSVCRFTGQEYDPESELYNYNARLYDPVMGRFITADTLVPDWGNPPAYKQANGVSRQNFAGTAPVMGGTAGRSLQAVTPRASEQINSGISSGKVKR